MVYNEELKRDIPEGWEVKEVEDVIDRIIDHRGKTPKKLGGDWSNEDDSIIALSAKIVKGGKLRNLDQANRVNRELYDKWMSEKLIDGDVLMTSEAPAGEFYFMYGMTEYCLSQRLFALRANPSIVLPSYFYYELSSGYGYYQIMGSLSGSTVFGIRQDVLRTIKVVVPERGIQTRFDSIVLPQLKKIKEIEKENAKLTELRDWLLPMLMNGQVTVN
jgi:type I restriction enzyme S subunit